MSELPQGWAWSELSAVAEWGSGGTPKAGTPGYYGGPIPWAVIGDLTDGPVSATASSITQAGLQNSSAKVVSAGTVLIAMYGSIGKLGLAATQLATNQAIAFARTYTNGVHPLYLFYYLMRQRNRLAAAGKGATQQNISQTILRAWPIPVAPYAEQERIVAALDEQFSRIDAGVAALKSARQKLKRMLAAVLEAAVKGQLSGQGTSDSALVELGTLIKHIEAGKSFKCEERPATADEWGVIKVSAMTWGSFREQENKTVLAGREIDSRIEIRAGDLLVSRANTVEYVGAVVLVGQCRRQLLLSDKSLRLVPNARVLPGWLVIGLRCQAARRYIEEVATGTSNSMRNLSQPKLKALQLPLPPLPTQRALIEIVDRTTSLIDQLAAQVARDLATAARLRSAVLAAAFSGQLVAQDPGDEAASVLLDRISAERAASNGRAVTEGRRYGAPRRKTTA